MALLARQNNKGNSRVGSQLGFERDQGWFCREQMGTTLLEHLRGTDLGWRESALGALKGSVSVQQGSPGKRGAGLT